MSSKKFLSLLIAPLFAVGMTACDVNQTEEGDMPDVQVEEGQLPAYDVEGPQVDITEDTVTVPDVDVNTPEEDGTSTNLEGNDEGLN